MGFRFRLFAFALVASLVVLFYPRVSAQTTISTGSIQGTVRDASGAVLPGAKITITNQATGRVVQATTSAAGTYTSGALIPASYTVRVEAEGFKTTQLTITVLVGVTASGNATMQVGQANQVVEVRASANQVDTEQVTVQGTLTTQQIENLPINGRNFLDLAQLEPGVQIQDGGNFDPTKNGFSSISFGGRYGRTARIEVDGVDVSDEEVGTTTQNFPASAIQEFQIEQSSLDLSTELTSSGAVNVVTRSGSNNFHGEAYGQFRDHSLAANLPGGTDTYFQRDQYGGNFGGPIIRDKLFIFLDAERTQQALNAPVIPSAPFVGLTGFFDSPFRETEASGRLDWQIKPSNYHFFYRFSYDQNKDVATYLPNTFQPFNNVNHNPSNAVGLDFTTGDYTHSFRFGYMKFRNGITDAVAGSNIFNPAPQLELAIGSDPFCLTPGLDAFCSGPNYLAPQATIQSNHEYKYDGSRVYKTHIFRYGVAFNHIHEGGDAYFLSLGPAVNAALTDCATVSFCNPANPLTYPANNVILGNGQGFSSELPAFGLPGGGQGPDNRLLLYFGDSWKLRPNLTLLYGLRYNRDTGRTDSDLAPIPCSELAPSLEAPLAAAGTPCTGNILDLWGAGLGDRVRQPNNNFGPQLGIAWDPSKQGKTVVRAGIGLFYENNIWNNQLYDRPPRLSAGLFLLTQTLCNGGSPQIFTLPGTSTVINPGPTGLNICGQPIGTVESAISTVQHEYQASTAASGAASNPGFIGNTLSSTTNGTVTDMFAPNYQTPRSVQMNFGLQHQFGKNAVFSADFVRNVETHTLLAIDVNHVGDARYFNKANAIAAINSTLTNCGVGSIAAAIAGCPNNPETGAPGYNQPATIADFAANGLDSANFLCGGAPCSSIPGSPLAAFPGINQNLGANQMLFPVGRSVYNGLQLKLTDNIGRVGRGVKNLSLQAAYSLSRYVSTSTDSDFINNAVDNNNPDAFIGPNGLDRTHQISFGGVFELPAKFQLSLITHVYSPLPVTLQLPVTGNPGGIFVSDVTGDGSGDGSVIYPTGDVLPGTNIGSYGRGVNASNINNVIANYNNTYANQPTPAGQDLINSGLISLNQLRLLGGVQPLISPAPAGQANMGWLKIFDLEFGWAYKLKDRVTLEPGVSFYNLFNFSNFDGAANPLSGILDGSLGSVNGTAGEQPNSNRLGLGSGVFALGAPRAIEFTMKVSF
jgi:Carboxypeptidase regulatory-like domain